MASRGGYRKPANPAPVSGPGELARRTDGAQPAMEMTGGTYGENQELMDLQTSAPMAQVETDPSAGAAQAAMAMPPVTPLFAPSQRPDEPATAGMPFGPGQMSAPMMPVNSSDSLRQTLLMGIQSTNDPELEYIYAQLASRGII